MDTLILQTRWNNNRHFLSISIYMFHVNGFVSRIRQMHILRILKSSESDVYIYMFRVSCFVSRIRQTQIWKVLKFPEKDFDVYIFMKFHHIACAFNPI